MLLKLFLLITLTMATILAEAPLQRQRSGPYAPSGFRPRRPFNLPGEYVPPTRDIEQQQQPQQPNRFNVAVNKERVDFVSQVQGNSLDETRQPQSAYLPPNRQQAPDDNSFSIQHPPNDIEPQFFQSTFQARNQQRNPQFAPRKPQEASQQQRPQYTDQQPTFGQRLPVQDRPRNFQNQPTSSQQFFPQEPQPQQVNGGRPAQQYGVPEPRNFQQQSEIDADVDQQNHHTAIEALNAAVDDYNQRQSNTNVDTEVNADSDDYSEQQNVDYNESNTYNQRDGGPLTKGQYYILGPNNKIQRVMFTTTQNEQESRNNGFTAQLKYTPVGAVKDPLFKYNNRGQLVRVVKK